MYIELVIGGFIRRRCCVDGQRRSDAGADGISINGIGRDGINFLQDLRRCRKIPQNEHEMAAKASVAVELCLDGEMEIGRTGSDRTGEYAMRRAKTSGVTSGTQP